MNEPGTSAALFLRSLTQNWSRKESIDLLTYLDAVLKWNSSYLQEVISVYAGSLFGEMKATLTKSPSSSTRLLQNLSAQGSEMSKASTRLVTIILDVDACKYEVGCGRISTQCFYTLVFMSKMPS